MGKNNRFDITTIAQLEELVDELKPILNNFSLFLLSGSLGAGKTEFVKAVIRKLHGNTAASSPTFALHQSYLGQPLIEHWDLYRLQSEEDLESTGFWDQFIDTKKIIFIEWPERLNVKDLPISWSVYQCLFEVYSEKRFFEIKKL